MQPLTKKDPKKIGGYTLIGRLGSGGMGVVYLASKGSDSVALKVIRDAQLDDEAHLSRFKREISTLETINHPNVAKILGSGVDAEQAWFAVEFANGPDLAARVKDKGALTESEWWSLAEGLLSALESVHAAGVIHRDVKPSNIILTEAGPKLIDFGIAQVTDATSVTSTGTVAGSPAWFSPEQIEGFELNSSTDIFSAGSVLTYAATGSTPWGDETTMTKATVFKILKDEPDTSGLQGPQREFVESLLQQDPSARPTARNALKAAESRNSGSIAKRTPPKPPVERRQRQNKASWTGAPAIAAGLLVLTLVVIGFAQIGPSSSSDGDDSRTASDSSNEVDAEEQKRLAQESLRQAFSQDDLDFAFEAIEEEGKPSCDGLLVAVDTDNHENDIERGRDLDAITNPREARSVQSSIAMPDRDEYQDYVERVVRVASTGLFALYASVPRDDEASALQKSGWQDEWVSYALDRCDLTASYIEVTSGYERAFLAAERFEARAARG